LNKYLKCSVWRLALRYDIYIYIYIYVVRLQKVKKDEARGVEKTTQRGALCSVCSPNIIRMIKTRSWAGHVARVRGR